MAHRGAPHSFLCMLLAGVLLTSQLSACGTILYPERRGQPAGRFDADIVILDAVGLLFFFVPGVIAFAVDFATGTIYLPDGQRSRVSQLFGAASPAEDDSAHVARAIESVDDLSPEELAALEAVLLERTGRVVDLRAAGVRTVPLDEADDVDRRLRELATALDRG